jgi:2-oxoglutarate dehydrogenase complex dihydrolipoamide succinyltransferase (E2) component
VDEPVVEIMTDKVTVEVPSPAAGILGPLLVPEGTTVPVGEPITNILAPGEKAEAPAKRGDGAAAKSAQATPHAPAAAPPAALASARPAPLAPASTATARPGAAPAGPSNGSGRKSYFSPVVRRLAREHGVDPSLVRGTGRGGRVTREDMLAFLSRGPATTAVPSGLPSAAPLALPAAADGPLEEVIPLTGVRKVIAERMVQSKFTATHVTTFEEVDVSAIVRLRDEFKREVLDRHGVRLTFTPFFVKAAVLALRDFPSLNATWRDKETVVVKRYYNIGVAVGRDAGLMVPVVKDAGRKSLVEIARDVNDLSERAHANRIKPEELQGGTFSITNAGLFGSFASTPIINYPEVAILGVHKIALRPTVVEGEIVARPMTNLALTFDHRWIDGHLAVQFVVRVKQILEKPERLWWVV